MTSTSRKPFRKAVFPVAGLGTRFLPATEAMPKQLLPIIDKPIIQYAVEEAVAAEITDLIFVTGRTKRAIEDHFDANAELERALRDKGKDDVADMVRNNVPEGVRCNVPNRRSGANLSRCFLPITPCLVTHIPQVTRRVHSSESNIFDINHGFDDCEGTFH